MLLKVHLTSHSRISGSRWVITPWWFSGSWFLYSSVYFCHPFLISSASVRSLPFLSFIEPILAWNVPLVSLIFLKRSLSLSHSIVFLYFFALIAEEGLLWFGILHSNGYIFPFLLCFLLPFFSQLFVRFSLFIYFIRSSVYMSIPISQFTPLLFPSLITVSLFSTPLYLFLLCQ